MGSIGPAEILVVLVVALLVLGPARLPEAARSVGKAVSEIRRATNGLQSEVRDAFSDVPPVYPTPRTDEPVHAREVAMTPTAVPEPADDVVSGDVVSGDVVSGDAAPAGEG